MKKKQSAHITHDFPIIEHKQSVRIESSFRSLVGDFRGYTLDDDHFIHHSHNLSNFLQHLLWVDLGNVGDVDVCIDNFIFCLEICSSCGSGAGLFIIIEVRVKRCFSIIPRII
jgi:hypothetical protein